MQIISDLREKIKNNSKEGRGEQIAIIALIFLTGFSGFALGRLSRLESEKTPIKIEKSKASASAILSGKNMERAISGGVVASKYGSVYHFPWCSGAERMKTENKIWFESIEKAKEAGLRAAKNCKGLK